MTRSTYKSLISKGVTIYEYTPGFMHSKQMIVDGKIAYVGTLNLDYRSLSHHFECGAVLYDTPCINDIAHDFEEIFAVSEIKSLETSRQRLLTRAILSVLAVFRPLL